MIRQEQRGAPETGLPFEFGEAGRYVGFVVRVPAGGGSETARQSTYAIAVGGMVAKSSMEVACSVLEFHL